MSSSKETTIATFTDEMGGYELMVITK